MGAAPVEIKGRALQLIPTRRSSPWSNTYQPLLDDGTVPSAKLRELEVAMNDAFDTYREMCVLEPSCTLPAFPIDLCTFSGTTREASPRSTCGTSRTGGSPAPSS